MALGDLVLGIYLHGSIARQQAHVRSDLDVLVIAGTSLGPTARRDLATTLLQLSGHHPRADGKRRPVELTVVSQADVRPWRYPPRIDFLYGEWLREAIEGGRVLEPHRSSDLAVVLADVLARGLTLLGPPADQLLDPVPSVDVIAATRAGVAHLLADLDSDTTNVLLTLARAWATVDTGELVPKDEAATWALPRIPHDEQAVLAHARSVYLDEIEEDWGPLRRLIGPTAARMAAQVT